MSELSFDSIFEACCARIEQGASIAECLASYPELNRYPEQAAELAEALAFVPTLHSLAVPPPPPARLHGPIRDQFRAEAARLQAPAARVPTPQTVSPAAPRPRPAAGSVTRRPRPAQPWWERLLAPLMSTRPLSPVWATMFVLLAITTFSTATLSVAEAALPGDLLYPIKFASKSVGLAVSLIAHPQDAEEINRTFDQERIRELQEVIQLRPSTEVDLTAMISAAHAREHIIVFDPGLKIKLRPELWDERLARNVVVKIAGVTSPDMSWVYATALEILEQKPLYSLPPQATPTLAPMPTLAPGKTPMPTPTLKPRPTRRPPTKTPRPTNTPRRTATPTRTPLATPTPTLLWTATPSPTPGELTPTMTTTPPDVTVTATETATPADGTPTPTLDVTPTPTDAEATPTPTDADITPTPTDAEATPTPTDADITPTPTGVNATATPTDTPADTPAPPTDTPAPPTETPVSPPDTPVPPTDTPVPPTSTPQPVTNLFLLLRGWTSHLARFLARGVG